MKCHAGVEFPSGKPCPKCNAKLGEVCWPGINADLLELARLRSALEFIARVQEPFLESTAYLMWHKARDALTVTSAPRATPPLCGCKASQRDGQHMAWCPAISSTEHS